MAALSVGARALAVLILVGAVPAAASVDREGEQKEHAAELYRAGRYAEALTELTAVYEAARSPDTLRGMAECHSQLGHHAVAAFFFRGYLDHVPDAADRLDVERAIANEEAAALVRPNASDAPATPVYRRWWLWTAVALVVAGGVTAIVLATDHGAGPLPMGALGTIDAR